MRTVFKYPFKIADGFTVDMPKGAQILKVECQDGTPCIWAMLDTDRPAARRVFHVFGTGHPFPNIDLTFVATFQQPPFVWHVFEAR